MKAPPRKAVLRHIARHRLSIRAVMERRFFDGNAERCHNTLNALLAKNHITTHSLGRLSYYEITNGGRLEVGLQVVKKPGVGSRLREHLAVLWYCHMLMTERKLLPVMDLRHLFPGTRLQAPHCIAPPKAGKSACIYRVRLAGRHASDWSVVSDIQGQLDKATQPESDIRTRLRVRQYGFAILCHSKERVKQLKARAREKKLFECHDGQQRYRVAHEFVQVPSPETLGEALNELRQRR